MPLKAPTSMHVVKKEEKEQRVREFVRRHLQARAAADAPALPTAYMLIARSPTSPVVKALVSLSAEIAAAGISVFAVFTKLGSAPNSAEATAIDRLCEGCCRSTRDARLLEGHEQLVLDATTAWVGDCMRREPEKRDAYERYAEGCQSTAAWASAAFERIWLAAEPVVIRRAGAATPPAENEQPAPPPSALAEGTDASLPAPRR